jgi:menaquinone-specific isochorismate synthase
LSSRFCPLRVQAPSSVTTSFSDLLAAAAEGARLLEGEGVLSLALPLTGRDPMALLSQLDQGERFRFLWDSAPGLCLAASGRCNSLELSGPRRFELAQRFSAVSLGRLAAPQACPPLARPRVLLAFSFFDSPLQEGDGVPGVQAVLPRWQLSRQGRHCWLRLQRTLGGEVSARSLAEELWEQAERLAQLPADPCANAGDKPGPAIVSSSAWQEGYRSVVERGLELVEAGDLRKLVLAVRQQLHLAQPLDPLQLLAQLRQRQPGSCRFLWQQADGPALLGASPERLLTVRQGQLRSDALAGTAPVGPNAEQLLRSDKDRREHALVVEAITEVLQQSELTPHCPRHPRRWPWPQRCIPPQLSPACHGAPRWRPCAAWSHLNGATTPLPSVGSTAKAIRNCVLPSAAAPCRASGWSSPPAQAWSAAPRWSANWRKSP